MVSLAQFSKDLRLLWENKPQVIVLLIVGFLVFVFVVVDAWRHRRRRKRHYWHPWRH